MQFKYQLVTWYDKQCLAQNIDRKPKLIQLSLKSQKK